MSKLARRRDAYRRAVLTVLATVGVAAGAAPVATAAEQASANGFADAAASSAPVPTLTNDVGAVDDGTEPQLVAGLALIVAGMAGVGLGLAARRPRTPSRPGYIGVAHTS